jgi:hypothetical protein
MPISPSKLFRSLPYELRCITRVAHVWVRTEPIAGFAVILSKLYWGSYSNELRHSAQEEAEQLRARGLGAAACKSDIERPGRV